MIDVATVDPFTLPFIPLEGHKFLPSTPGIYFAISQTTGEILYIGCSKNLQARLNTGHHRYYELKGIGNVRIAWMEVSEPSLMFSIEKALIEYFKPVLNRQSVNRGLTKSSKQRKGNVEFFCFPRPDYTLVVIELQNFQPEDLIGIESLYPQVDESKGVAIAGTPETPLVVAGDLFSYYRNRCQWQGAYHFKSLGILVGNAFGGSSRVRGEVIPAQLPCLECFRRSGAGSWVKSGSRYPYCEEHYDQSPHRRGSRRKKGL